ncbi:MAG TPA: NAD-dependent epimerase/dehydratase family protein [Dehalococcoidia bacterium]|jgi:nucleoside-diphosphate-sugar epimerase|nr:NAD-dependent epimerase/dehydratase family protein [Dehalococcoidia bacterium]
MRVLVAGGAGFIGSHVCEWLVEGGHEVTCLDNLITGRIENLATLSENDRLSIVIGDAESAPDLDVDLVMHLASPASPIAYGRQPIETMSANSEGTHRLLEVARQSNARFFYASTSEVYGDPAVHPQTEDYWGNVNPIGPRACYDEAKRFGEALTLSYQRQGLVNAGIVRIFNTYGPRMDACDGRVIPEFIGAALRGERLPVNGNGSQTRSFCYVSDLVEGIMTVALDRHADGDVFNVGNPEEVTMVQLGEAVLETTGARTGLYFRPAPPDDPMRRRPDIGRLHTRYGWQPRVGLRDGLARTVAYFRSQIEMTEAAS